MLGIFCFDYFLCISLPGKYVDTNEFGRAHEILHTEHDQLRQQLKELQSDKQRLGEKCASAETQYKDLKKLYDDLLQENKQLKSQCSIPLSSSAFCASKRKKSGPDEVPSSLGVCESASTCKYHKSLSMWL